MRSSSLSPFALVLVVALGACQQGKSPGPGGGGGGAYVPADQPPVNALGSQGPVVSGGRLERSEGGANAGAYSATPPEGYRGSGSAYNPHWKARVKKQPKSP